MKLEIIRNQQQKKIWEIHKYVAINQRPKQTMGQRGNHKEIRKDF